MKAGRCINWFTSVSPLVAIEGEAKVESTEKSEEAIEEESEGEIPEEFEGEVAERVGLEKEGQFVRKLIDPKLPTQAEVDMHKLTGHVEYRNWCESGVRCRGRDLDHRSQKGKERKFPEYSLDYCFPGDEVGFKWTVLVGRERGSKSWMATTVPMKGSKECFQLTSIRNSWLRMGIVRGPF